jgi:hypothetical protein
VKQEAVVKRDTIAPPPPITTSYEVVIDSEDEDEDEEDELDKLGRNSTGSSFDIDKFFDN